MVDDIALDVSYGKQRDIQGAGPKIVQEKFARILQVTSTSAVGQTTRVDEVMTKSFELDAMGVSSSVVGARSKPVRRRTISRCLRALRKSLSAWQQGLGHLQDGECVSRNRLTKASLRLGSRKPSVLIQ